jgi:hypothetical protein
MIPGCIPQWDSRSCRGALLSELEVKSECVVELGDQVGGQPADHRADALDRY